MTRIALLAAAATLAFSGAAFAQVNNGDSVTEPSAAPQPPSVASQMRQLDEILQDQQNQNDRSLSRDPSKPEGADEQLGAVPPGTDAQQGSSQNQAQSKNQDMNQDQGGRDRY